MKIILKSEKSLNFFQVPSTDKNTYEKVFFAKKLIFKRDLELKTLIHSLISLRNLDLSGKY